MPILMIDNYKIILPEIVLVQEQSVYIEDESKRPSLLSLSGHIEV